MSSDDAIFVQLNHENKIVAQWGTMSSDILPDPEQADPDEIFDNLVEFIKATNELALETEYGYQFLLDTNKLTEVAEDLNTNEHRFLREVTPMDVKGFGRPFNV